jgi:hypothetical protein
MSKLRFPSLEDLPHPRAAREKVGKTQEQVRREADIGIMTVVRSERSGAWPSDFHVLQKYMRAVGIAR